MVLLQELSLYWGMFLRTAIARNFEFREKPVNQIMKIGYVLSQVKCYIHWNHKNVNKLNCTPPVILNNKLPAISSTCYDVIIDQFKWF